VASTPDDQAALLYIVGGVLGFFVVVTMAFRLVLTAASRLVKRLVESGWMERTGRRFVRTIRRPKMN
jgi:hypothetical protein